VAGECHNETEMNRRFLHRCFASAVLFAPLFFASSAIAQEPQHTNFSGRWRMVKEESDFGKFAAPDIIVRIVDQHDQTFNVHTVQTKGKNTTTSDVSYFTSGEPATNSMSGRDAISKAFWDGDTLVIRTSTKNSKNEQTEMVDRWDLSPDGKTLTITSHIAAESGGADLKLVCRREAASH
jgi:hypothetical protein